jgi:HIV-1 Vpr-binding protein
MENYVIGNIQIYPPTLATRQVLILRYLTPMGEYQEVNKRVLCISQFSKIRVMLEDNQIHYESTEY